jgi:acyl-CoA dehydrogenase
MRRLLGVAIAYAGEREAFGRPLGRFQAIRHKIAEIGVKAEVGRALTYHALRRYAAAVRGSAEGAKPSPAAVEAASSDVIADVTKAKLYTQRACVEVADEVLQILGGYGYMREYGVERAVRDARLGPIGGGTDEVMKEILGRQLGL